MAETRQSHLLHAAVDLARGSVRRRLGHLKSKKNLESVVCGERWSNLGPYSLSIPLRASEEQSARIRHRRPIAGGRRDGTSDID